MEADTFDRTGKRPPGHWGKWRGVTCSVEDCDKPAKCKGMCNPHYNQKRWADGHNRPTPEKHRERRMRHRYGIGPDEYDAMFEQQRGLCAVCGEPPDETNTRAHWGGKLCVDHDHDTGQVRGLLCNDCNLAVGYGKSPDNLRAAADYLQRHA